jgi:hypothetical protein
MDIENTPRTLPKGSRDLRLLWVLRNFRLRMQTPKGIPKGSNDLRSHQVANCTTVLLLRKGKKRGGKSRSCAEHTSDQDRFRAGPLPDRVTSGQKGPTRSDIAQLPVAHTQNILPIWHVTDVTSGHVTSGHAQWSDPPHHPPQIITELSPYTTGIVHIPQT